MIKQNKEQIVEQLICVNCKSRKHQLLTIQSEKENIKINLLCMDCGIIQTLKMNARNKFEIVEQEDKQKENGYLG